MLDGRKLKELSANLVTEENGNYMDSFRKNLIMYLNQPEITISELSEISGVSYSTLNSIIYGKRAKDVHLSTVFSLANALNVSMDELVGAGTMEDKMRESVRIVRSLPEYSIYLIRYFIRHQKKLYQNLDRKKKYISLAQPQIINGMIATTNAVTSLCIDQLPPNIQSKAYLGIKMPCDFYMPYYLPGEIILIASDREAVEEERCVVTSTGSINIVIKKHIIENGVKKWKYCPLMNQDKLLPDNIIDDKIGYIIGHMNPDGSFGIR